MCSHHALMLLGGGGSRLAVGALLLKWVGLMGIERRKIVTTLP
jgi:hypothetical protein